MQYPGFIHGGYESQSPIADQEQTINFYVERMESRGASSAAALYPTPGVGLISTATSSPGRAHFFQGSREFTVQGSEFNEVSESGTITNRGTVATSDQPATISSNGDGGGQLFITAGSNGYVYDLSTNVLTQVAALNGKATMGDFLDGYFLALDGTNSTLYISALLDGSSWTTGTDFAQRTVAPDPWISMKVVGRYIWLLGEQTSEVWYDAGTSPFPFAFHPSGLISYGCAAPFSASVADGAIVWLGASSVGEAFVLRGSGFTPEVVSDYPRQLIFSEYADISDAQGFIYNWVGHIFYVLSFPSESITWVWDAQTGQWFRAGTWIAEDNRYVAWRPRWHAMAFGEHRILDAETGAIYRLTRDTATDVDSRPIRRVRRAPGLSQENRRIFYPGFELFLEPGLGTSTGQGSDPQVMLRYSNDGGKTWGAELWRSAGKIGEYGARVRWNRLGQARKRVFEVVMTDPIPWRIMDAYLTPDPHPISRPQGGRAA